jgi:acyl dehydratase
MREIADLAELKSLVGAEVALSEWVDITQQRVNTFADATGDHQWIHVDPERCRRESPFGGPIAHGFLTLSLLPGMIDSALRMVDVKIGVNYGLNKVRFPAPVPVGSRLRAHLTVAAVTDIEGGAQLTWDVLVEREGSAKPVCVAEFLVRRYP